MIFALGTLHLLVLAGLETMRFFQNRAEIQAAEARASDLESKVSKLKEDVDSAITPEYREAMARRLGYVRKDEILIPNSQLSKP